MSAPMSLPSVTPAWEVTFPLSVSSLVQQQRGFICPHRWQLQGYSLRQQVILETC